MSDQKLSDKLFASKHAESELEDLLAEVGVEFERIGWDEYDCSLELYGVPADHRLHADMQRIIQSEGFGKVYVNHTDKWETHYTFGHREFKEVKGWRVSYPHKRKDDTKGILVEEAIPSWPKQWFETGYARVVKP